MVLNNAQENGAITKEYSDFYTARAKGGVGLIILGATYVHAEGKSFDNQLGLYDDRLIPPLKSFCEQIKRDCKLFIQLSLRFRDRLPVDFKESQIIKYIRAFGEAARRALEAGFDGIEIHGCHDYFINQFLSTYTNKRTDSFGGILEQRLLIATEILKAVKTEAGKDLVVGYRINGSEFVQGGLGLHEGKKIAAHLQEWGSDYIHVTGGIGVTQHRMSPPMGVPQGSLLYLAQSIQKAISIPVIGVGRLDRPDVIDKAISKGLDMVAIGRALIADPHLVRKIKDDQGGDIRPCIACNECLWQLKKGEKIKCTVNPYIGKETTPVPKAIKRKKVVIIGGGPAGMKAAIIAAKRGHQVVLYEKKKELGGKLLLASLPPNKEPLRELLGYFQRQIRQLPIEVRENSILTPELLQLENPDFIIISIGSKPYLLNVPGIDSPLVITAEELLAGKKKLLYDGKYLVVGGGLVGLETALFIAKNSKSKVNVIEMTDEIGVGISPTRGFVLLKELKAMDVNLTVKCGLLFMKDAYAVVCHGERKELGPFDCIVVATGYKANHLEEDLFKRYKGKMELIGDCNKPGNIGTAIQEAVETVYPI